METSAKTNFNVREIFVAIAKKLPKDLPKDDPDDQREKPIVLRNPTDKPDQGGCNACGGGGTRAK